MKDVKIISMSCSTFEDKYINDLKKVIDYANKKNKLLICSSDNENKLSYPSYMKGVIGVQRCGLNIDKYLFNEKSDIQCLCKYKYRLLPNKNKTFKLFGGNSYCTAYFCGLVSNLIRSNIGMENRELIEIINKNSDKSIPYKDNVKINELSKIKTSIKTYNYDKLNFLIYSLEKFSNLKIKDINKMSIYSLVGIENLYDFFRYLEKNLSKNIIYSEITNEDLISIYSLYNFIFKG
ncbi:serine protease [[Clostridium] sordellii]|nr:serine protease [[Clostridium] sordellii] [Paeniclostridium sordellii]